MNPHLKRAKRIMDIKSKIMGMIFMRLYETQWNIEDRRYRQLVRRHDRLTEEFRKEMDMYDGEKLANTGNSAMGAEQAR